MQMEFQETQPVISKTSLIGTGHLKYQPIQAIDVVEKHGFQQNVTVTLQNITSMQEYKRKSFEELRIEDYLKSRGPKVCLGSAVAKFACVIDVEHSTDRNGKDKKVNVRHAFITSMPHYSHRSFEEIRLEDYRSQVLERKKEVYLEDRAGERMFKDVKISKSYEPTIAIGLDMSYEPCEKLTSFVPRLVTKTCMTDYSSMSPEELRLHDCKEGRGNKARSLVIPDQSQTLREQIKPLVYSAGLPPAHARRLLSYTSAKVRDTNAFEMLMDEAASGPAAARAAASGVLAARYRYRGNCTKALEVLEEVLPLAKETFGTTHRFVALLVYEIFIAQANKGLHDLAVKNARTAFKLLQTSVGSDRVTLARLRKDFGDLKMHQNETESAVKNYQAALKELQKLDDIESLRRDVERRLGDCYFKLGQFDEIAKLIEENRKRKEHKKAMEQLKIQKENIQIGNASNTCLYEPLPSTSTSEISQFIIRNTATKQKPKPKELGIKNLQINHNLGFADVQKPGLFVFSEKTSKTAETRRVASARRMLKVKKNELKTDVNLFVPKIDLDSLKKALSNIDSNVIDNPVEVVPNASNLLNSSVPDLVVNTENDLTTSNDFLENHAEKSNASDVTGTSDNNSEHEAGNEVVSSHNTEAIVVTQNDVVEINESTDSNEVVCSENTEVIDPIHNDVVDITENTASNEVNCSENTEGIDSTQNDLFEDARDASNGAIGSQTTDEIVSTDVIEVIDSNETNFTSANESNPNIDSIDTTFTSANESDLNNDEISPSIAVSPGVSSDLPSILTKNDQNTITEVRVDETNESNEQFALDSVTETTDTKRNNKERDSDTSTSDIWEDCEDDDDLLTEIEIVDSEIGIFAPKTDSIPIIVKATVNSEVIETNSAQSCVFGANSTSLSTSSVFDTNTSLAPYFGTTTPLTNAFVSLTTTTTTLFGTKPFEFQPSVFKTNTCYCGVFGSISPTFNSGGGIFGTSTSSAPIVFGSNITGFATTASGNNTSTTKSITRPMSSVKSSERERALRGQRSKTCKSLRSKTSTDSAFPLPVLGSKSSSIPSSVFGTTTYTSSIFGTITTAAIVFGKSKVSSSASGSFVMSSSNSTTFSAFGNASYSSQNNNSRTSTATGIFGNGSFPKNSGVFGSGSNSVPSFCPTSKSFSFGNTKPADSTQASSVPLLGNITIPSNVKSSGSFGIRTTSSAPSFGTSTTSRGPAFKFSTSSGNPSFKFITAATSSPFFGIPTPTTSKSPAFSFTTTAKGPIFSNPNKIMKPSFGNPPTSSGSSVRICDSSSRPSFNIPTTSLMSFSIPPKFSSTSVNIPTTSVVYSFCIPSTNTPSSRVTASSSAPSCKFPLIDPTTIIPSSSHTTTSSGQSFKFPLSGPTTTTSSGPLFNFSFCSPTTSIASSSNATTFSIPSLNIPKRNVPSFKFTTTSKGPSFGIPTTSSIPNLSIPSTTASPSLVIPATSSSMITPLGTSLGEAKTTTTNQAFCTSVSTSVTDTIIPSSSISASSSSDSICTSSSSIADSTVSNSNEQTIEVPVSDVSTPSASFSSTTTAPNLPLFGSSIASLSCGVSIPTPSFGNPTTKSSLSFASSTTPSCLSFGIRSTKTSLAFGTTTNKSDSSFGNSTTTTSSGLLFRTTAAVQSSSQSPSTGPSSTVSINEARLTGLPAINLETTDQQSNLRFDEWWFDARPMPIHTNRSSNLTVTSLEISCDRSSGYLFSAYPVLLEQRFKILIEGCFNISSVYIGFTDNDPLTVNVNSLPSLPPTYRRGEYWSLPFNTGNNTLVQFKLVSGCLELLLDGRVRERVHVDTTHTLWLYLNLGYCSVKILSNGIDDQIAADASQCPDLAIAPSPQTSRAPSPPAAVTDSCVNPASCQSVSREECIICFSARVDSALYSCGHSCMCFECAADLWRGKGDGKCPICRERIRDVIRLYKS